QMAAFFNNTTQNAMDGNIKDTPPTVFVPKASDRDRWNSLTTEARTLHQQLDARTKDSRPDFDAWLAGMNRETLLAKVPMDALAASAKLDEGSGTDVHVTIVEKMQRVGLCSSVAWDAGHLASSAFKIQPGVSLELDGVGDFEKDNAFSYG